MKLTIRGIQVHFPYEPYDCQRVYMEKVIESLQQKKNALLESPTGTGKTLCLLCAALAWRRHQLKDLRKQRRRQQGGAAAVSEASSPQASDDEQPPKGADWASAFPIVYASRTHSQLAQVIRELKNTKYKPRTAILGSRQQMCVHDAVKNLKGEAQNALCRALVSRSRCSYNEGVQGAKENEVFRETILDIEDLVKEAKSVGACPYYLSRELQQQAELTFMPYNYLIDPLTRRSLSIDLRNAVLIFDEAHNLETVCCEAASFEIRTQELEAAIKEIDRMVAWMQSPQNHGGLPTANAGDLGMIRGCLVALESKIYSIPLTASDFGGPSFTAGGVYAIELLNSVHLTADTSELFLAKFDSAVAMLSELRLMGGGSPGDLGAEMTSNLGHITETLKRIFTELSPELFVRCFKVHINQEAPRKNFGKMTTTLRPHRVINCWCLDAGVAMKEVLSVGVRSLILTSGTLSPLDSFAYELKTDFAIRLENKHVITPAQVWVGVVPKGPSANVLNSSYKSRSSSEYLPELGNAIVNYSRMVPDGMLVFFPSYSMLDQAVEHWKQLGRDGAPSTWERIEKHKPIIQEPRTSAQFPLAIQDFYAKVASPEHKGAVLFAVFRGKVSEGLDFANANARAVVVTGMPYPNVQDPKVRLKREYLDQQAAQIGHGALSGTAWYNQQASRAVNQAIGRVIRHRHDWGAIILADNRFMEKQAQSMLSRWLHGTVKSYATFGESAANLTRFFKAIGSVPDFNANLPRPEAHAAAAAVPAQNGLAAGAPLVGLTPLVKSSGKEEYVPLKPPASDPPRRPAQQTRPPPSRQATTAPTPLLLQPTGDAVPSTQDAAAYIRHMKSRVSGDEYARFSRILRSFKEKSITLSQVVVEITDLFKDPKNHDLIRMFSLFCSPQQKTKFDKLVADLPKTSGPVECPPVAAATVAPVAQAPPVEPASVSLQVDAGICLPVSTMTTAQSGIGAADLVPHAAALPPVHGSPVVTSDDSTTSGTPEASFVFNFPGRKTTHCSPELADNASSVEELPAAQRLSSMPDLVQQSEPMFAVSPVATRSEPTDDASCPPPPLPLAVEPIEAAEASGPATMKRPLFGKALGYDLVTGHDVKKPKTLLAAVGSEPAAGTVGATHTGSSGSDTSQDRGSIEPVTVKVLCLICRRHTAEPYQPKCGHMACLDCWKTVLAQKLECPFCRGKTRLKQLNKVPL